MPCATKPCRGWVASLKDYVPTGRRMSPHDRAPGDVEHMKAAACEPAHRQVTPAICRGRIPCDSQTPGTHCPGVQPSGGGS